MIIKSITMHNFRQYKGMQKIHFSINVDKNVTIIKGENGAGKTTLLEAFIWCFYNQLTLPNNEKLLTSSVVNNMKLEEDDVVSVEVNFIHQEIEYYVQRRCLMKKSGENSLKRISNEFIIQKKRKDGTLKNLKDGELEKIIPQDLSTYFFFDGERIENMSKSNLKGKRDLSKAIKNILGLDVILNSKKHLEKVKCEFEKDFNSSTNKEMNDLIEQLENGRSILKNKEESFTNTVDEIACIEELIKKISEKLKEFDDIKVLEKEREQKQQLIIVNDSRILEVEKEICRLNKKALPEFLVEKVLNICKDKIDFSRLENKGIVGIDGAAIDQLINRGRCICGQELRAGTECFERLIKQKQYQPPASLGTIISQFTEKTTDTKEKAKDYFIELEEAVKKLEYLKHENDEYRDSIDEISDKLIGIDKAKEYEQERIQLTLDLSRNEKLRLQLEHEISLLKIDIQKAEGELSNLALNDNQNKVVDLRKKYTEAILDEITKFYLKKEEAVRKKLNDRVTEIFSELLCTNHRIELDEDYSFIVKDIDGEESTSQGQDVITSFAFIGGIIDLAKKEHKEIEVNEPYPLIMDAPFAKLSKTHRRNVAKLLPNIAEQFILITVDSQYEGDIEDTLLSRIGKEYELVMHMEDEKYTEVIERS